MKGLSILHSFLMLIFKVYLWTTGKRRCNGYIYFASFSTFAIAKFCASVKLPHDVNAIVFLQIPSVEYTYRHATAVELKYFKMHNSIMVLGQNKKEQKESQQRKLKKTIASYTFISLMLN